ncbi:MAG TPA: DUF2852 domain-containing protein [Hyphomicrobiales bacterium]|nr:DUF2852 domain-containing protein [Hyphomicrobiales bacterium]
MYLAERIDDIGKPAWIALMVASFIIWWPIGLATLAFLLWSGRMGCGYHGGMDWRERRERWRQAREEWRAMRRGCCGRVASSGNLAFDDYRAETLKRLEEEQKEFTSFLDRLRRAKDKAEFDQFMAERRNRPAGEPSTS